ncbi:MAG: PEGA domain-containing protein [Lachnospira sp.]
MNFNITNHKNIFVRILTVFLVIVMVTCQTGCSSEKKNKKNLQDRTSITPAKKQETVEPVKGDGKDKTMTGVLSMLDTDNKYMYFVDISSGKEYSVPYSGGTDIKSAHDVIKAAATMKLGEIYDVYCDSNGKAEKIYGSKDAWMRTGITGISVDENSKKISFGATNLYFNDNTVVFSNEDRISVSELVSQDELTLYGIEDKLYGVNVDVGHGYLFFTGVDAFIGGYVSIGPRQLYGVSKDMLVTAKEGTYTVDIRNSGLSGNKTVTVKRGEDSTVDFSDVVAISESKGSVNFQVTPANAVMSIDGKEVDYSSPVSLSYGAHTISLVANYYENYTATINVSKTYETITIDMVSKNETSTEETTASTTASTIKDNTSGYSVNVTAPVGATLYVDSEYIGTIPCSFKKSSGSKIITLVKTGYKTVSYTIYIANQTGNVTYSFPDMESQISSANNDN